MKKKYYLNQGGDIWPDWTMHEEPQFLGDEAELDSDLVENYHKARSDFLGIRSRLCDAISESQSPEAYAYTRRAHEILVEKK